MELQYTMHPISKLNKTVYEERGFGDPHLG